MTRRRKAVASLLTPLTVSVVSSNSEFFHIAGQQAIARLSQEATSVMT